MSAATEPATAWEIDVPLLSNRIMVGGVARVFVIAAIIMGSLLTLLFAVQGEFDAIGPIWLLTAAICGGMLVLSVLVMLLVFRNRIRFRFTVTDHDVLAETIDSRTRGANRLAVIAGMLGRQSRSCRCRADSNEPGVAERGLLGRILSSVSPACPGHRFQEQLAPSALRVLHLRELRSRSQRGSLQAMDAHATATRVPSRSPVPRYLGYSALVVLCCVPAFLTVEAFDVSLLIPLLMLCFALAMIWLVGVFGLIVMVMSLVELGAIALDALGRIDSFLEPGRSYARWTIYSGDDWALIALTIAGLAGLCWLSVRAVADVCRHCSTQTSPICRGSRRLRIPGEPLELHAYGHASGISSSSMSSPSSASSSSASEKPSSSPCGRCQASLSA